MMNTKINNYFAQKAQREQEAKKAELAAMVEAVGIDEVLNTMLAHLSEINKAIAEVEAEEKDEQFEEAKRLIPTTRYHHTGKYDKETGKISSRPVGFSEKTKRIYYKTLKEAGVDEWIKGNGAARKYKITHPGFAKYIIEISGNKGDMLKDIIDILWDSTWNDNRGITQEKMEIVYHTLVLHRDKRKQVVKILTDLFKNYDKTSMKVAANQRDEYRNHLSYKEKMMMFVEDEVCKQIGEQPLFARETQTA